MTFMEFFSKQLEEESVTTRKMLSRVPTDKFSWKPHDKSMEIKRLATHIAELPTWIPMTLDTDELDFKKAEYKPAQIENTEELLIYFEDCLKKGMEALKNGKETNLDNPWILRNGDEIYNTSLKKDVIRMSLSQIIHHRAQLGVFLRLLNISIPGSYGPSADEMKF